MAFITELQAIVAAVKAANTAFRHTHWNTSDEIKHYPAFVLQDLRVSYERLAQGLLYNANGTFNGFILQKLKDYDASFETDVIDPTIDTMLTLSGFNHLELITHRVDHLTINGTDVVGLFFEITYLKRVEHNG